MKKRAFVESLKEMGTAPFGLENDKTEKIFNFYQQQESEIEEANGMAKKFGANQWNAKLAGLEKRAFFGISSSRREMNNAVKYDSMLDPSVKLRDNMTRTQKVFDSGQKAYNKTKTKLFGDLKQNKLGIIDKARFKPSKRDNKIQSALGLIKKSSRRKALVFNVKKERTNTEPKKTVYMDHSNYLATKEKLASLKRRLNEGE